MVWTSTHSSHWEGLYSNLWDMPIHTDREIEANKPDIIIRDMTNNRCMLIDMAFPAERNTSVKVIEKSPKYKDMEIEINRMRGVKKEVVPIAIGILGHAKKGLEKFIVSIPGNDNIWELQKPAYNSKFCQ